jgi:hypothetical protein
MKKGKFRKQFDKIVKDLNEFVLPNTTTDYIINIIKARGYWSGISFNIHYNENDGFSYSQRKFGVK